jgi:NADPH-dependent glutamate synthase beta subunit-like oxidoreductase
MKLEDATAYTKQCFNGEPATCSCACPFHLDIRSFLDKAGKGRWAAAYKELRNAVVFPGIVSALCPQPCRDHCQRTTVLGDEALALRDLETARSAMPKTASRRPISSRPRPSPSPSSARAFLAFPAR